VKYTVIDGILNSLFMLFNQHLVRVHYFPMILDVNNNYKIT